MSDRLMRLKEVLEMSSISRSELYRQVAEGRFPRPVKVGLRAVRWWQSEVEAWRPICRARLTCRQRPRIAGRGFLRVLHGNSLSRVTKKTRAEEQHVQQNR